MFEIVHERPECSNLIKIWTCSVTQKKCLSCCAVRSAVLLNDTGPARFTWGEEESANSQCWEYERVSVPLLCCGALTALPRFAKQKCFKNGELHGDDAYLVPWTAFLPVRRKRLSFIRTLLQHGRLKILLVDCRSSDRQTEKLNYLFDLRAGLGTLRHFVARTQTSNSLTTIVTWLILPVVICLSQRLSHACLSTSLTKVKPRMAH